MMGEGISSFAGMGMGLCGEVQTSPTYEHASEFYSSMSRAMK